MRHEPVRRTRQLLLLVLVAAISAAGSGCGGAADKDATAAAKDSGADADDHAKKGEKDEHGDEEKHEEGEKNRVTLGEAAFQTAQIRTEPVRADAGATAAEELEVPGQIDFDPRRVALISPRTPGRIERLTVVEGDRVTEGQTVALLNSPAYLTAQSDLQQAARRAAALAGTPDEQGARALVQAARRRLTLLGVGEREISRLESGGEPGQYLAVTAPFSGNIVEAHALTGEAVEAGKEIFKLADLSVVDVVAEVPERSVALVRVGQPAAIGIAAYPNMRFAGTVERLRDQLNPETRTVRAVIHAPNGAGRLRPGMFATVRLSVPTRTIAATGAAAGVPLLTIPSSAVVTDGERRFVFVEVGERAFERREVQVASLAPPGSAVPTSDRVAVRSGLAAGDRVVVNGAFTLKSELAKAGLGEHSH